MNPIQLMIQFHDRYCVKKHTDYEVEQLLKKQLKELQKEKDTTNVH